MNHSVEEWLFVAMHRDMAPEFRTVQHFCDEAYSGPEQRRQVQDQLSRVPVRRRRVTTAYTNRQDTALAA